MDQLYSSAKRVYQTEGASSLAQKGAKFAIRNLYGKFIRPYLAPDQPASWRNEITVISDDYDNHLLDPYFFYSNDYPNTDFVGFQALRNYVSNGDTVLIIGAGNGVSMTVAARNTCPEGRVVGYEAGRQHTDHARETIAANGYSDCCTVHHAVIGEVNEAWSPPESADVVSPSDLPDCEFVQMNCEGAELKILREFDIRPAAMHVQVHECFGAPVDAVEAELDRLGYSIVRREPWNEEKGIYDYVVEYDG